MAAEGRRSVGPWPTAVQSPAAPGWQIACSNRQRRLAVRQSDIRGLFTAALIELKAAEVDLSIAIVNDTEIAQLHARWLDIPGPTDVLSFDLSGTPGPKSPQSAGLRVVGEVIASGETAVREAARYHWRPEHELAYYLLHGLLHLCGFDDLQPGPRRAMRRRERQLMQAIGLPSPPRRTSGVSRSPSSAPTPPRMRH